MLFKRIIEGKSVLKATARESERAKTERCLRRKSECAASADRDSCRDHSTILEEMLKTTLLGLVLWAGVTLGSLVAPYPLSLIVSADVMHQPPTYDFPFPSAEMLKRLPPVRAKHTNRSIAVSKTTVAMLEQLENNLGAAGVTAGSGTAARGLLLQSDPTAEAMHYEKSSMIITLASKDMVYSRCSRFGLPEDECASFVSTLNLRESEFGAECASLERFACGAQKKSSSYRSFDGSCNNPMRSSWGQALTGYKRLLHPRYADGIQEPRRATERGRQLPSPRAVSTRLVSAAEADRPERGRTLALAVWSQFVQHDLTHTPVRRMIHTGESIRCCDTSGYNLAPRHRHPSCMPISVPRDDRFFGKRYTTCMEYTRSVTTYRGDCTFGAAEQMNQATHFLDGSHIYGATARDAAALRGAAGGLLRTEALGEARGELLPLLSEPRENCRPDGNETACFEAGDLRANMHPWLGALHTVFVREHNRLARALAALNPGWGSDRLYHEARAVVIAQLQHVTYEHWLPALTGRSLDEMSESYDTGYNREVDPTVSNAFSTAALHFVNSLLDGEVRLLAEDGALLAAAALTETFYRPALLAAAGGLEGLLRGMARRTSRRMDLYYADDVSDGWLGGLDALAVDTQRGRDHGLPAYHLYRTLCGLPAVTAFRHFADHIPQEVVDKLSALYAHPHDVDLVVGAMAERPQPGSLLGPTFTCLLKEQLWRTRAGDRFFYAHPGQAGSFSRRQLAELRRSSLARLLCDNAPALRRLQRDLFAPESDRNPAVSCGDIKRLNLEPWREPAQQPAQQPDIISRTRTNLKKWIKTKVTG